MAPDSVLGHLVFKTENAKLRKWQSGFDERVCAPLLAGAILAARNEAVSEALTSPFERLWEEIGNVSPTIGRHPGLVLAGLAAASVGGGYYYSRSSPFSCAASIAKT